MTIWNRGAAILGFAAVIAFAGQTLAEDKMARPGTKQAVAEESDAGEEEPIMWAGGSPDFCESCGGEVIDEPAAGDAELSDPYEGPVDEAAVQDGVALSAAPKAAAARSGHIGNRSSDASREGACTLAGSSASCTN